MARAVVESRPPLKRTIADFMVLDVINGSIQMTWFDRVPDYPF
jgi:hypothetical protein